MINVKPQLQKLGRIDLSHYEPIVGLETIATLREAGEALKENYRGQVWHVNSTPSGGGVAEMLPTLCGLLRGLGIPTQWCVIEGADEFFFITKQIHNILHGQVAPPGFLSEKHVETYEKVIEANFDAMPEVPKAGDIVVVHDNQPAGLIPSFDKLGAHVVWRSHVGTDFCGSEADNVWAFLCRFLSHADGLIFTRSQYVPQCVHELQLPCSIIKPTIDPLSLKNLSLTEDQTVEILSIIGLLRADGGPAAIDIENGLRTKNIRVERKASIVREGPPSSRHTRFFVQISRWDRLKDHLGVMIGFAKYLKNKKTKNPEKLLLVGPTTKGIQDDPEQEEVFKDCHSYWSTLPKSVRKHIEIIELPVDDIEENALMVNALQRHAFCVIQKSIEEGFGLTVTEAMWKAKPVIGTAVGGIQDQLVHRRSGMVLSDPINYDKLANFIKFLSTNPEKGAEMGKAAMKTVLEQFLVTHQTHQLIDLFRSLINR